MISVSCGILLQLSIPRPRNRHIDGAYAFILTCFLLLLLPSAICGDHTAIIEVTTAEISGDDVAGARNHGHLGATAGSTGSSSDAEGSFVKIKGIFLKAGNSDVNHEYQTGGEAILLKTLDCKKVKHKPGDLKLSDLTSEPPAGDWVAVVDASVTSHVSSSTNDSCYFGMDMVRNAMLLGASAAIILSLNQSIMKELDVGQLFSKPVIFVQAAENISAILNMLSRRVKCHMKVMRSSVYSDMQKFAKLTMWTTCGRPNGIKDYGGWDGVVCLGGSNQFTKADPGHFWNYFFSALLSLLLLLIMKSRHEPVDDEALEHVEKALRRLAHQALTVMKVKRYNKNLSNYDDSERDTCAVCLDHFLLKQKVRVLPCEHEFHTKCVDPWLVRHQTCPLCKLNIIDAKLNRILYEN